MCKVPDTSTQRPALRPNSTHHMDHYIVHGPGDARDCVREPAVAGLPCAPPLAYDLTTFRQISSSPRPPSRTVSHMPLRRRQPRRLATPRNQPRCSRRAPLSHRGPSTWLYLSSSLSGGNGVRNLVGLAFGSREDGEDRGISELRGAFVEPRTPSRPSAEIMPCHAR